MGERMNEEEMVQESVRAATELDRNIEGEHRAFKEMLACFRTIQARHNPQHPLHCQISTGVGALSQLVCAYETYLPVVHTFPEEENHAPPT